MSRPALKGSIPSTTTRSVNLGNQVGSSYSGFIKHFTTVLITISFCRPYFYLSLIYYNPYLTHITPGAELSRSLHVLL